MSEAFEILSAALNEAIEDAKSKNPKLERREVEIEVAEKNLTRKNISAHRSYNLQNKVEKITY